MSTEKEIKNNEGIQLAVMARDIQYIKQEVSDINENLKQDYVTRNEFDPIKKIVYGVVSILLTGVIGAVLAFVIK